MKLATNPIVLRMALVFVAAGFAFVVGLHDDPVYAAQHQRRSIVLRRACGA